jgi:hypothetical protein
MRTTEIDGAFGRTNLSEQIIRLLHGRVSEAM